MQPTPHENRFSEDLQRLLDEHRGKPTNLGEIEASMKGRGFAVLIIVLTAPFALPVTIPGLSTIFGLGIATMGLRLSLGMKPWLPQFVLRRPIQYSVLEKIVGVSVRAISRLETVLRPRWEVVLTHGGRELTGLGIMMGGLLLALPLPPIIPFTNWFPGVAVMLLAAGYMERDGLVIMAGHFMSVVTLVYFAAMAWVSYELCVAFYVHLWDRIRDWFTGAAPATQPATAPAAVLEALMRWCC